MKKGIIFWSYFTLAVLSSILYIFKYIEHVLGTNPLIFSLIMVALMQIEDIKIKQEVKDGQRKSRE